MKITGKKLSEDGLVLTLDIIAARINTVYLDNAKNYDKITSDLDEDHTAVITDFEQEANKITIKLPDTTPTFFIITLKSSIGSATTMYMNQYSVFKAKTAYLSIFEPCNCDNNCNSCCNNNCNNSCYSNCSKLCTTGCGEKNLRMRTITLFLRLNLMQQSYNNDNIRMCAKYYIDACRIKNMDRIPFEYKNLDSSYYNTSGKLLELFVDLNNTIKSNVGCCEKKALELLLLNDLYSLIFSGGINEGGGEVITESIYYGYINGESITNIDEIITDGNLSKLKSEDITKAILDNTIKQVDNINGLYDIQPIRASFIVILIPEYSRYTAKKYAGIGDTYVKFNGDVVTSNGESIVKFDNKNYKVYGEEVSVEGKRTIKIS